MGDDQNAEGRGRSGHFSPCIQLLVRLRDRRQESHIRIIIRQNHKLLGDEQIAYGRQKVRRIKITDTPPFKIDLFPPPQLDARIRKTFRSGASQFH
jgi:hypothetical protein